MPSVAIRFTLSPVLSSAKAVIVIVVVAEMADTTAEAVNRVPDGPDEVLMTFIRLVAVCSFEVVSSNVPATELWSPATKS